MSKDSVTTALEVAGLACVLVAAFAADWRVGLALVGVVLVLVGFTVGGAE